MQIDKTKPGVIHALISRRPFSFDYAGKPSSDILDLWKIDQKTEELDSDRTKAITTWADPKSGLKVHWETISYSDFPAFETILYFENIGTKDTSIISNIKALDMNKTANR